MSSETEKKVELEIVHVLFLDIVGYSKQRTTDQHTLIDRLNQVVRGSDEVQRAEAAGRLIKIPTGDGMALVFYRSPEQPVECALEIAAALKEMPDLQVRMGVHSGPISTVQDVNEQSNAAGVGINIAQRVMDCGDAGHILLSKRVAEDLEQYGHWQQCLHDLGKVEVKHGLLLHVFNLYTAEVGNPAVPEKLRGALPASRPDGPKAGAHLVRRPEKLSVHAFSFSNFFAELKRRNVYRAVVGYVAVAWVLIQVATQVFPFFDVPNWAVRTVIILLVGGFPLAVIAAWLFELTPEGLVRTEDVVLQPAKRRAAFGRKLDFAIIAVLALAVALLLFDRMRGRAPHEKSIAVLPFENLSEHKENAFFADGLQDDLLTNLARIKDLRVISRTSVKAYRGTEGSRNLRDIGAALSVANILEGSVRRSGDRVVVNAQLIDVQNDRPLWANRYNRTLADSLGIEGELANEIAEALRVTLTQDEKARVSRKPTESADAYELYLRALPYEQGPDTLLQDYRRAEELYRRAIELDPNFALAHARLASTCAEIFHFHEPLESWSTQARSEAAIALRLQPNLGEAHFALAQCLYWIDQDYEKALTELAVAQQLLPNDTSIGVLVAAILRRQGQFEKSLAAYEQIQKLDPQNPNIVRNLIFTNTALRRWPQAAEASDRLRRMAPDSIVAVIQGAYIQFWWKGKTAPLDAALAGIAPGVDPDGIVTAARWEAAMLARDFDAAEKVIAATSLKEISYSNGSLTPLSFFRGCIALARGDKVHAAVFFEDARQYFEKSVAEAPDVSARHANLGLIYAFLGRKDEAIAAGKRAIELKPVSKDAYDGALMLCYMALIYARVGEDEQALTLIEQLLKTPGAVDSVDYSITTSDLKFRWEWDVLRKNPRIQKLLAGN